MSKSKGFTLVELIVTMAIFVIVIMLSSFVFEKVIGQASHRSRAMEGQIEGVVGLELMRTDLDSAGFGLYFSNITSATRISYSEAVDSTNFPVPGINRKDLNDAPSNSPRGVVAVNGDSSTGFNRSDYLVVKSVLVAMNYTAKKSSFVTYTTAGVNPVGNIVNNGTADDFLPGERAIVVKSTFELGKEKNRELLIDDLSGSFFFKIPLTGPLPTPFSPKSPNETCLIYGIDPDPKDSSSLRMPFNRADYFISRPGSISSTCNTGTGVLYKATCNHNNGGITYNPLVDCVGDMQVVYLLDMDEDGTAGTAADPAGNLAPLGLNPEQIEVSPNTGVYRNISIPDVWATLTDAGLLRSRLKEVRVYILAQLGQKDTTYQYPASNIVVGDPLMAILGRTWTAVELAATFGADWRNYRWKVYTLTAKTTNMK